MSNRRARACIYSHCDMTSFMHPPFPISPSSHKHTHVICVHINASPLLTVDFQHTNTLTHTQTLSPPLPPPSSPPGALRPRLAAAGGPQAAVPAVSQVEPLDGVQGAGAHGQRGGAGHAGGGWCMVHHGVWCMVRGAWCVVVHGAWWCMVRGWVHPVLVGPCYVCWQGWSSVAGLGGWGYWQDLMGVVPHAGFGWMVRVICGFFV